ncbi:MAG: response regulator transcription factor [Christensenellaceae bacterium]|jgi:DNA-binding response OmpR family regulator|nr:response regulator transcription factor [Christensenellaceae bacterium]
MAVKQKTILAVEDEPKILEVITSFLESGGYAVFGAETGAQALAIFERENISLVLLDLMLPDMPGEAVCQRLRQSSRVPILMLTAKVEEESLLNGLGMGADDYITKPFSLKALGARIEAALRRANEDVRPLLAKHAFGDGDLIVDFEKNTVKKRGEEVLLTPSEMNLLAALVKYPGKVFTRAELIEIALGSAFDGYDRAVDTHIKNLRQKIESDSKKPDYIVTVHGLGYKFGG